MSGIELLEFLNSLQSLIPQYVLGSLPAIATIGTTPETALIRKLKHMLQCFGCPFIGMFYFCNIGSDPVAMSAYWLSSEHFVYYKRPPLENKNGENYIMIDEKKYILENERGESHIMINGKKYIQDEDSKMYRPFGFHAKNMNSDINREVFEILEDCVAESSLLDRLSSLVSVYYVTIGVLAGIYKAAGPCVRDGSYQDWPYIPLALIWTLPAICIRMANGMVVSRWPAERLKSEKKGKRLEKDEFKIIVIDYDEPDKLETEMTQFALTALASVTLPWMAVIIAYFTRPMGFFCRSKYLTVVCSIWSFNSILAIISHIIGERPKSVKIPCLGNISIDSFIRAWFCICGVIMMVLLILLVSLLADTNSANANSLWVAMFGPSCDVSSASAEC